MCLEIIEVREAGIREYIDDFFNKAELILFLAYCYNFTRRMTDQTDPLVPSSRYADPIKDPHL